MESPSLTVCAGCHCLYCHPVGATGPAHVFGRQLYNGGQRHGRATGLPGAEEVLQRHASDCPQEEGEFHHAGVSCQTGDGEGAPIHMPMIRLETVEKHRMYCLMPSNNFMVKKSGTQAGIEPTTFGAPTHCSNHGATEALVTRVAIGRLNKQSFSLPTIGSTCRDISCFTSGALLESCACTHT